MRGNGLPAADYVPIVDLDPQLADAMLEMLREESIAAYAKPVFDHRTLADLPGRLVDRPLDRLYVDRTAAQRARELVRDRLPDLRNDLAAAAGERSADPADATPGRSAGGPGASPDDQAWAGILAAYASSPTGPAPWPASEDLPDAPAPSGGPAAPPQARDGADASPPAGAGELPDGLGVEETSPEDEGHFVPPPPPPLPRSDRVTRWAWIGLLGAPIVLFVAALLGADLSGWPGLLLAGAFVGGFVTLVARMKDRPDSDDDPDDGAVV
jgi:hypothetical protein